MITKLTGRFGRLTGIIGVAVVLAIVVTSSRKPSAVEVVVPKYLGSSSQNQGSSNKMMALQNRPESDRSKWVFFEGNSEVKSHSQGGAKFNTLLPKRSPDSNSLLQKYKDLKKTKWIVLTTIQAPTPQVVALSKIPNWQLLVVGDTKTPEGWSLNGTVYLGPDEQVQLGYVIGDVLPFQHYSRKNIGYMFAIQHGAEYIYETDDDNVPFIGLDNFNLSPNISSGMIIETGEIAYNPCRHFGQSTLWPRGYPLDRIGTTDPREYKVVSIKTPPVQQGFVNGDPDLDAIYRLTRKHKSKPLDLYFDEAAPPVILPEGTFAPMNSQNTMYHKSAFWGLVFPCTIPDRIADIYRAYWMERILWLIGEMVAFFPPNAYQERTAHSYIKDASLEINMYLNTPKLLKFLNNWKCSLNTLPDCINDVTAKMAEEGFWGEGEVILVRTWLKELQDIGYTFPALKTRDAKLSNDVTSVVFYPNEKNTSLMYRAKKYLIEPLTNHEIVESHLLGICNFQKQLNYGKFLQSTNGFKDIVLVVGLRNTANLPSFESMHRGHFPNIIYCASKADKSFFHKWNTTYVPVVGGPTAAKCLSEVFKMKQIVKGFLYVPDSALVFGKSFQSDDFKDTPWVSIRRNNSISTGPENIAECMRDAGKSQRKDLPIYLPKSRQQLMTDFQRLENEPHKTLSAFVTCSAQVGMLRGTTMKQRMTTSGFHYVAPFTYSPQTSDTSEYVCSYIKNELEMLTHQKPDKK